ncbi:MAG: redox-sensing transcriptional repressor Rex [Bacteroidetes bacterium]|nr:MAG: redox-sensing transcriptional repressor Rex [Bacteroidota bacterium]
MIIKPIIKRLLQYRLCLLKLKKTGFEHVFSQYIADELGISAEQVRKDFSEHKIKGKKKLGYHIEETLNEINLLLGKDTIRNVIVIGMGNIGRAIIKNNCNYRKNQLNICAGFDINPRKQKEFSGINIYKLEKLTEIIKKYDVKTAILAVPQISSQLVCNRIVLEGIIGIMNFTPVVLNVPKNVIINNVNLCNELESLVFSAKRNINT